MIPLPSKTTTGGESIRRLRNTIYASLLLGIALFTAISFSILSDLRGRFGPSVRADLAWRVQRGAQELAKSADLGLAVSDEAMVRESFGVYAASNDVRAIVAVGADGAEIARHGDPPEAAASLMSGAPGGIRVTPDYLVSWAPAEIEGSVVGRVAVVVTTARLQAAAALLDRALLTITVACAVGLLAGLLGVWFFTRAVAARDARLSEYAATLEHKVADRTRELGERTRGMRLVLDHVLEGFLTIDLHGVMASERSATVDRWFGTPAAGTTLGAYLGDRAGDYGTWLDLGLEGLRDDFLPAELVIAQLPPRMTIDDRIYHVAYTPISEGDRITSLLVIIRDATDELAHIEAERAQRETVAIFQRIASDRGGVEELMSESNDLVQALTQEHDPVIQKRHIHTLKGNSSIYGLETFAATCHDLESEMDASDHAPGLTSAELARLVTAWRSTASRVSTLLGDGQRDRVEITVEELTHVIGRARGGASAAALASELATWRLEPVERRLARLGRQAQSLAARLGKPAVDVAVDGGGIRIDAGAWGGLWSSMIHLVRNAVDHGIEDEAERRASSKAAGGQLTLAAFRASGDLVLEIRDDGRGINWSAVKARAERLGLAGSTHKDLVEALFSDGLSTREQATETSGRGVGLGALRAVVRELGGSIEVDAVSGRGTTFRLRVPERKVKPGTQEILRRGLPTAVDTIAHQG